MMRCIQSKWGQPRAGTKVAETPPAGAPPAVVAAIAVLVAGAGAARGVGDAAVLRAVGGGSRGASRVPGLGDPSMSPDRSAAAVSSAHFRQASAAAPPPLGALLPPALRAEVAAAVDRPAAFRRRFRDDPTALLAFVAQMFDAAAATARPNSALQKTQGAFPLPVSPTATISAAAVLDAKNCLAVSALATPLLPQPAELAVEFARRKAEAALAAAVEGRQGEPLAEALALLARVWAVAAEPPEFGRRREGGVRGARGGAAGGAGGGAQDGAAASGASGAGGGVFGGGADIFEILQKLSRDPSLNPYTHKSFSVIPALALPANWRAAVAEAAAPREGAPPPAVHLFFDPMEVLMAAPAIFARAAAADLRAINPEKLAARELQVVLAVHRIAAAWLPDDETAFSVDAAAHRLDGVRRQAAKRGCDPRAFVAAAAEALEDLAQAWADRRRDVTDFWALAEADPDSSESW